MPQSGPVTLFISYTHEDEPFCRELEKHLSLLQRQNLISTWHDRRILAGTDWAQEIDEQFERASMILLLISADFLASDYCYGVEMKRALERHVAGEAQVIPILVRPCHWRDAPFAHMRVLPIDARPISIWPDRDEAWTQIVAEMYRILQGLPMSSGDHISMKPPALPLSSSRPLSSFTLELRNRMRFLAKLRNRYEEILNYSFQGAPHIALHLHSKPDEVINNTRLRLRQANVSEYPLPAGTTLLQAFDRTGGELLVLGDPGTGKTTQLLTLADSLCQRAEQDEHVLMPVIVNLSTWATSRKPLAEWLVEEVMKSYEVPRGPITRWIEQDHILPLLDGLDEVDTSVLPICIEAINTYKQQHFVPLVVSCRTEEYAAQQNRLALQNAVVIQRLEEEQVDAYFKAGGASLAGIRSILRGNTELRELVRTPLMLHVITYAYQGVPLDALPKKGTTQELQQQLFQQYVKHMLTLPHARFSSQSMIWWISWLAQQMRAHNLTIFYLEHLQPEWLPIGRARQIYELLTVRLYGILLGILVSLLVSGLTLSSFSLYSAIGYGLTGGLIGGLISGNSTANFQHVTSEERGKWDGKALGFLRMGRVVFIAVSIGWVYMMLASYDQYGYIYGISAGLCAFLLCCVIAVSKETHLPHFVPHRRFQWWWKYWHMLGLNSDYLRFGGIVGLLLGLSNGLSAGLISVLNDGPRTGLISVLNDGLSAGMFYGLITGLNYSIIGFLLSLLLLSSNGSITLTEVVAWSVNRLAQSLFNVAHLKRALCLFLLLGLSYGLIAGLGTGLSAGLNDGVLYGLIHGLSTGLSFGLIYGLRECLRMGLVISLVYLILLGIWNSLSQEVLDDRQRSIPNEGVRRSVRNGIFLGLIAAVLCGLVAFFNAIFYSILSFGLDLGLSGGLLLGWGNGLIYGLNVAPIVAIAVFLLVALLTGGLAGLRHLLLRILLARAGLLPWRTISFLDEATHRILLYRDGGGYRFIHRLLLEYFAKFALDVPLA